MSACALLPFLDTAVDFVRARLGRKTLRCMDVFSGSGIVSRFLKSRSSFLAANDLELYARIISRCYLANESELNVPELRALHERICAETELRVGSASAEFPGIISEIVRAARRRRCEGGRTLFLYAGKRAAD